jgi:hypothetical protein
MDEGMDERGDDGDACIPSFFLSENFLLRAKCMCVYFMFYPFHLR